MSEKVFFSVPCKPGITLQLKKDSLTFFNEYSGRNVLSPKAVAQMGFDLCENADKLRGNIVGNFKALSGISLDEITLSSSKYAPVETKVFGTINENTAVYSLGILLRDLLISTGRSDTRLKAILDKACDRYPFTRYNTFCELKEDLAVYLKAELDEEIYGVIIVPDKPLPEPIFKRTYTEKPPDEVLEAVNFKPYSKAQEIRHTLSKRLTLPRVQIILAAIFILFSSISIPITSMRQSHDVPTFSYYENYPQ